VAETVSQADIDAFLGALPGGAAAGSTNAPATPASLPSKASAYDFSHPDLLSRDRIRSVHTLHEGYAQALAKRLSTELLMNVSVSVSALDHLTYGEFLMLLPAPTVLAVIEACELDGNIAIMLDRALTFAVIDRLLGGVGAPLAEVRSLTAIEQGLMERVLRRCCRELELAWAPITALQFRLQSIESNPELARVVGPNEMVVLVTLEVKMRGLTGTMNICLPYVVMEPAFHRMAHGSRHPRIAGGPPGRGREALSRSMRTSRVELNIDLGSADLSLREFLELTPGDILRIAPLEEHGAEARVEGVPMLSGVPGRFRGHRAFEVRARHPRNRSDGGGKNESGK
jgi:flagellar motor switch protein FliM